jgi:hypothetical protein
MTQLHENSEFVVASITLLTEMKAKIKHQVDIIYGFDTSHAPDIISQNTVLAQALLADLTFIYQVCPHCIDINNHFLPLFATGN